MMDAFLREHCPYIGSFDDPETHYSFVTEENACCVTGEPEFVGPSEQGAFCLRGDFERCPRFVMPPSPLSQALVSALARRQPFKGRRRWSTILVGAILGLLTLSGLVAWGFALWFFTVRSGRPLPTQLPRWTTNPIGPPSSTVTSSRTPTLTLARMATSLPSPRMTPTVVRLIRRVRPDLAPSDLALEPDATAHTFLETNETADPNAVFWRMESDIPLAHTTPVSTLPSESAAGMLSHGLTFPAPELLKAKDGTFFVGRESQIALRWGSIGEPDSDAWYQVEIWGEDEDPRVLVWTKERDWLLDRELYPGEYRWRVRVVRQERGVWLEDLSPPSETRSLIWR